MSRPKKSSKTPPKKNRSVIPTKAGIRLTKKDIDSRLRENDKRACNDKKTLGTLFICATPIGNLSDTTTRLLETLNSVDRIVAEDTRTTLKLLNHFGIKKPLSHLEKYNEAEATHQVISWIRNGQNLALVSDAGTPGISDPGAFCVSECIKEGVSVVPIPGPSAVTTLLSASGLASERYTFTGFFPKKESEQMEWVKTWCINEIPIVFFETSPRLSDTLEWLIKTVELDHIVAGKELTKKFETILSDSPEAVYAKLKTIPVKGEWCIAIRCKPINRKDRDENETIRKLASAGFSHKDIKKIADCFGYNKNTWYKKALGDI